MILWAGIPALAASRALGATAVSLLSSSTGTEGALLGD